MFFFLISQALTLGSEKGEILIFKNSNKKKFKGEIFGGSFTWTQFLCAFFFRQKNILKI